DRAKLVLVDIVGALVPGDLRLLEDVLRLHLADAVDVRESDFHALVAREVDASQTSHLTLPLLVTRVRADDEHDALAPHHLALVANLLHRRADLHRDPQTQIEKTPLSSRG